MNKKSGTIEALRSDLISTIQKFCREHDLYAVNVWASEAPDPFGSDDRDKTGIIRVSVQPSDGDVVGGDLLLFGGDREKRSLSIRQTDYIEEDL